MVYHHSDRRAYIISCYNSVICYIKPIEENDYLHISLTSVPGYLKSDCVLDLPFFMDFNFSSPGEVTLVHSGKRTLLKIPPGTSIWELKATIPMRLSSIKSIIDDYITVGDAEELLD